jgi:ABC-type nickel/cobalt efflux system permease component RcnA
MLLHGQNIIFEHWPLVAGVVGAMVHVVTGPDHLAAVMPFAVEHKRKAWKIGISWGLGHLTGMLLIGVLFMLFQQILPIEAISAYSEFLVGFVLIGIGVWAIYRIRKGKSSLHQHPHYHETTGDFHIHQHQHPQANKHVHSHVKPVKSGMVGSFSVGILHGLAGVAHFILFLPLLSFSSTFQSVGYIIGFGIGTVMAMTAFALIVGLFAVKANKSSHVFTAFRYSAAVFALLIGVYWVFVN